MRRITWWMAGGLWVSGSWAAWGQVQLSNRQQLWTEQVLVYNVKGPWGYQLDHQYNRQASNRGTQDWNIVRLPLQQMLRPWLHYRASERVRWGLSPLGIWWNWSQDFANERPAFSQEFCTIPELNLTPAPNQTGERTYRFRLEFRLPTAAGRLNGDYNFLADGEAPYVRADRLNIRFRTLAEYRRPLFRRRADDRRWFGLLSTEPMVAWGAEDGLLPDQNRLTLALGRRLSEQVQLQVGYLSQLRYRPPVDGERSELRFRNILLLTLQITRETPGS
jgi:hypothetical protein